MNEIEANAIVNDTLRMMHQYGLTPAAAMARMKPAITDPVMKGQAIAIIQQRIQMQHAVIREAQNRANDLVSLRDFIQGATP
jgi:hypothetical protein